MLTYLVPPRLPSLHLDSITSRMSLHDLTSQQSPQAGPSRPSRYVHAHGDSTYTHVSTNSFASSSSTPTSARDARFPLPGPGHGPVPAPVLPPGSAPTHVQAIHDFDPKRLASTSQANPHMYLCFRAGDVIRVYSRDERGWWDGEVANATEEREGPRRGWFPSNYVREMGWDGALHRRNESTSTAVSVGSPISHRNHDRKSSIASHHSLTSSSSGPSPTIRSLPTLPPSFQPILVPIVQSLSLLEASISSRRRTHFQPSTACVISAIRSALAEADCLSKESDTLTRWPVLAKERKLVLVELSRLVTCARDASGTGTAEGEETSQVGSVEELGKAARNVFASVQIFFTMAAELGVQPKPHKAAGSEQKSEQAEVIPKPPLPPAAAQKKRSPTVQSATSIPSGSTASTRPSRVRSPPPSNPRMQDAFRKATSVGDLRAARRRASSPPPPLPTAPALISRGNTQSPSPSSTPMSSAFGSSSSSGRSSPAVTKSTHVRRVQGSMDSTVSHASSDAFGLDDTVPSSSEPGHSHPSGKRLSTLEEVLKAIQLAEERLFSIVAALVGHVHAHHHHAHPSSHALLIETTRETVDSIRELLTVVEAVGRHDGVRAARPAEVDRLRVIKDELYDVASQLVESAEVVANAPFDLPEAEEKDYARQKSQLLNATTSTLRKSSECLRAVRLCVPQDEAELEGTPRPDDHVDPRQATPRPADHGASLRVNAVGARGLHTLSGLHRKATSLSQLQRRYQQEVGFAQSPEEDTEEEDDDEEVVSDMGRDEDVTLRPTAPFPVYGSRPGLIQTQSSPGLLRTPRPDSGEPAFGVRSRSSSLTSPAPPSRIGHRSPSRSADLDRFTGDMDVRVDIRRPSTASSTTTSMSQSSVVSSRVSEQWGESGRSASALGFPSGPSSRSSINAVPSISFDTVRNSTTSSSKTGDAPQTPETTEDSPMLGYLRDEQGAAPEVMPRIGSLRIDTDATPIKPAGAGAGFAFPRPPMERSATAPLPVHLAQAQAQVQAPQSQSHSGARFWAVAHDYDPREISFNPEGAIIGASLRVIVEKMTPHDGPVDTTFSATFWYTFRLFTDPMTLLEEMIRRYDLQPPPGVAMAEGERALWIERKVVPVRLRIYNFLKAWLDTHWRSETDDVTLTTLRVFASDVVSRTLPAMAPRLLESIQRRSDPTSAISSRSSLKRSSSSDRLRFMSPTSFVPPAQTSLPPTPIISKSLHSLLQKTKTSASAGANATRIPITDFDTTELARQLTLTEWKLFAAVEPEDLLQTGRKAIPELKALSTLSNQITGWVADGILNEQDSKKRAGLLKFYIKLADKCLALNNFSTLFAILAGLNSSTILRLKKTWDALPSKYRVTMDRLRGVIEHTKNHAAYRARLREVTGPCLPFLGLILTDITFTSDGNADTRPSVLAPEMSLINQDKYNKLGKIALDFVRYQEPFNFHELDAVQAWLQRVLAERGSSSLDALYRKSLMLEPRSGAERPSLVVEKPGWLGVRGLAGGMAALG